MTTTPTIGIFDSGFGGFTVLRPPSVDFAEATARTGAGQPLPEVHLIDLGG